VALILDDSQPGHCCSDGASNSSLLFAEQIWISDAKILRELRRSMHARCLLSLKINLQRDQLRWRDLYLHGQGWIMDASKISKTKFVINLNNIYTFKSWDRAAVPCADEIQRDQLRWRYSAGMALPRTRSRGTSCDEIRPRWRRCWGYWTGRRGTPDQRRRGRDGPFKAEEPEARAGQTLHQRNGRRRRSGGRITTAAIASRPPETEARREG
jgi:hypothetical protein